MNIIINQQDLDKGLSYKGTFTRKQSAMLGTIWSKNGGWGINPVGRRCRAETLQRFIEIRSKKKD